MSLGGVCSDTVLQLGNQGFTALREYTPVTWQGVGTVLCSPFLDILILNKQSYSYPLHRTRELALEAVMALYKLRQWVAKI